MSEPYQYVKFRWWSAVDLNAVYEEMKEYDFVVTRKEVPEYEIELSIQKDFRDELVVNADTLTAHLSQFRAVLTQKEATPFSPKDVRLRDRIVELYPRNRPIPLPWDYIFEPDFEIE